MCALAHTQVTNWYFKVQDLPRKAKYNHYSHSKWPRLSLATFRELEGRSCVHSDKHLDRIISHFNSTYSSAQYSYKINSHYPPTHTCTFHVASSLQVSRLKLYTHFSHTSSMSYHLSVLYFNTAILNGPQCIWPIISSVTSQTVFYGCRQHIDRRYCYMPWEGVHTFDISVLHFVLRIYSLYVNKENTRMF